MIKNTLLNLFLCLALSAPLFSQNVSHGTFGALEMKSLSYKKQNAFFVGGRFGWVINKKYVIGAGYYSLINSLDVKSNEYPGEEFDNLNYGGLELEYYYFNSNKIHASASLLLGGGGVTIYLPAETSAKKIKMTLNLLVYEPRLCFEYSIAPWLNASFGISYRLVTNLDGIYGIYNKDFSGPTGSVSIRFGDYR